MTNHPLYTPRVRQVLQALERGPRTAAQLLKESTTFDEPYTNINFLRRNLQKYGKARWVRSWRYATTEQGALNYYKLTRNGFRLLHPDQDRPEPSPSFFAEIPVSRQEHAQPLADVVVHAIVTSNRHGITLTGFHAENQLVLRLGDEALRPDFQMTLRAPTGEQFRFLLELDNGTEPVFSSQPQRESIQRKVAFYERYQDYWFACWKKQGRRSFPPRFRVLFLTRSTIRVREILSLARRFARWNNRRLCYATTVPEFLGEPDAIRSEVFLDHFGRWQPLVAVHPPATGRPPVRLPEPMEDDVFV